MVGIWIYSQRQQTTHHQRRGTVKGPQYISNKMFHQPVVLLFLSALLVLSFYCLDSVIAAAAAAAAFAPRPKQCRYPQHYHYSAAAHHWQLQQQQQSTSAAAATALLAEKKTNKNPNRPNSGYDTGEETGYYMLAVALGVSLWFFTIPPEFRRANVCSAEYEGCISPEQWVQDVGDYYRNGGGIQWDFSIDPRTLEKNQKFLEAIRSNFGSSN